MGTTILQTDESAFFVGWELMIAISIVSLGHKVVSVYNES